MIDVYGWLMTYEEEKKYPPYRVSTFQLRRDRNMELVWVSTHHFCSSLPNIWALEVSDRFQFSYHCLWEAIKTEYVKLSDEVVYIDTQDSSLVKISYEQLPLKV